MRQEVEKGDARISDTLIVIEVVQSRFFKLVVHCHARDSRNVWYYIYAYFFCSFVHK